MGERRWLRWARVAIAAPLWVGCAADPAILDKPSYGLRSQLACGADSPLVVDWPAAQRAKLEAKLKEGPVAVRYSDCSLAIVDGCTPRGSYTYTSITPKRDRVLVRDASELYARMPVGAASLEGRIASGGELVVDMTIAGSHRLAAPAQMAGACEGATHVIAATHVGAFTLYAGRKRAAGAEASAPHVAAGAGSASDEEILSQDGDPARCAQGSNDNHCGAIVAIELAALAAPGADDLGRMAEAAKAAAGKRRGPPARHRDRGMVAIGGGVFRMGGNGYGALGQRLVTVASFELDVREVSVADYRRCVDAGACTPPLHGQVFCVWGKDGIDDHPVNCVDAKQAEAYCGFTGARLPSEEEWEYAALGDTGHVYVWGNEQPTQETACWYGRPPDALVGRYKTCSVGSHPQDKSLFGIYDLAGSVAEWTASGYCDERRTCAEMGMDGGTAPRRVIRGGSFMTQAPGLAAISRGAESGADHAGSSRIDALGFRCAKGGNAAAKHEGEPVPVPGDF